MSSVRCAPQARTPSPPAEHRSEEEVTFVVAGVGHQWTMQAQALTAERSQMLHALVHSGEDAPENQAPRPEMDDQGRILLEGPRERAAFEVVMSCVQHGVNSLPVNTRELVERLPGLETRLEVCRYADYYILAPTLKAMLTKALLYDLCAAPRAGAISNGMSGSLSSGSRPSSPPVTSTRERDSAGSPEAGAAGNGSSSALITVDVTKMGLCQSEMILERVHLDSVNLKGLRLANSHVKSIRIQNCQLSDCEVSVCVTANEVRVSRSTIVGCRLGVFCTNIVVDDSSTIQDCNMRVIEDLFVENSSLQNTSFQGTEQDRKDRQTISAHFRSADIYGDISLPFDKIVCEGTKFHGGVVRMTKGGAAISFAKTRLDVLPSIESESRVGLFLEDCDVTETLAFRHMRMRLSVVRLLRPVELVDVEFPERVSNISFPPGTRFQQVKFKHGLQEVTACGCIFEGCNLGYGQDAVSSCLLTKCQFTSCRFPFLEADAPVANFSGSDFVACRIQWSGQFPHEESFVINSYWCRRWNLSGATVAE